MSKPTLSLFSTTKDIGDYGERAAVHYLRRHGYHIIERNWRCEHLELDIIAAKGRDIAFIEVKTRSYPTEDTSLPPPRVAVDRNKQLHTRAAAQRYLAKHPTSKQPRMDVIEVCLEKKEASHRRPRILRIEHLEAAY